MQIYQKPEKKLKINFRCTAELKRQFYKHCDLRSINYTTALERAMLNYLAEYSVREELELEPEQHD